MNRILVIEDDAAVRCNVLDLLREEGFEAVGAEAGERGVALALAAPPDLIICDVSMPGVDGYGVFELLSERASTACIPFIFLSARAERGDVRRGMALGADDYLTKPFTRRELLDSIHTRLRRRRSSLPALTSATPAKAIEAHGPALRAVFEQIGRVAKSAISVLILGETGVGKELIAERIHAASQRRGRFVAINCAALSETLLESELFGHEKGAFTGADRAKEGLFAAADGGSLFLDEVGELPLSTQVKLLRVLEARQVMPVGGRVARAIDVRFVAATHRDVEGDVERGTFRRDLFYRLNGITLLVPPLRERRGEIEQLAEQFLVESSRSSGRTLTLSAAVRDALCAYSWPGNIRELRNVIERAALLCDGGELQLAHLPAKLSQSQTAAVGGDDPRQRLLARIDQLERDRICEALAQCHGNQTQAAERLGISRRTLVTRLSQYGLPRPRSGS